MRYILLILTALMAAPLQAAEPGTLSPLRNELDDLQRLMTRVQQQLDELKAQTDAVRAAAQADTSVDTPNTSPDALAEVRAQQVRINERLDQITDRLDEMDADRAALPSPQFGLSTLDLTTPDAITPPPPAPGYATGSPSVSAGSGPVYRVTNWPGRNTARPAQPLREVRYGYGSSWYYGQRWYGSPWRYHHHRYGYRGWRVRIGDGVWIRWQY